jgi:hypothetical protein
MTEEENRQQHLVRFVHNTLFLDKLHKVPTALSLPISVLDSPNQSLARSYVLERKPTQIEGF